MFHQVADRRVHSLSFGAGPGTLVGVAGSFANWEIWAPVFELLSPRWRVIGFDHDGVGETKVPVEEITHERHVETLFSVLDAQHVERCVIAGDSANAAVAIAAVLSQPERFDGLVVANGHAWGFDRPEVRRFVEAIRAQFEPTVDFFVDLVFPEPDTAHLKQWLRDIIFRTGAEAAARILEANYPVDLRPQLSEVRVPTLIIHGVLDAISPTALDDAQELAAVIPGARLQLLDDAGHLPLLSRPTRVADILDSLLTETAGPAAR
jgi:pimeloyl-ACP methyl ester carboxylesterase